MNEEKEISVWDYKPRTENEIKLAMLYMLKEQRIRELAENTITLKTFRRMRDNSKKENDLSYTSEIKRIEGLNTLTTVMLEEIDNEIKSLKKTHK